MSELAGVEEVVIVSSRYVTFVYDPDRIGPDAISQRLNEVLAEP